MAREKGMGNLQREKSGRWTMRVGIDGKRYCRSTRTKDRAKAERFLQRFLAPFGLGEHRLPLADVWLEYVKSPNRNELARATLEGKRNIWLQFARWMEHSYLPVDDLAGVTAEMIGEYLACIRAEVSATTYNCRVCVLREIFHTLAAKAGLDEDPWEGVRLRPDDSHSRRELTMDELKRLLAAAKRHDDEREKRESEKAEKRGGGGQRYLKSCAAEPLGGAPGGRLPGGSGVPGGRPLPHNEWHTLFLIGIYTGLRLGDCCRLEWSSVNLAQGIIQLVPRKTRRHSHGRPVTIPIHPALGAALVGQQTDNGKGKGPVLPGISEMYGKGSWRVAHGLKKIFSAANIATSVKLEGRRHKTPEATFHSLRHTFVSFAANAGVPLHIVQSIVGHESTAMTRHYYHENIAALQSAVSAIPMLQ